ncbi:MAG: DNA-binding protein, partial [Pseudomonadota bacterium]|nr:DNA-binding protein [Pseudomonadota bacterium]
MPAQKTSKSAKAVPKSKAAVKTVARPPVSKAASKLEKPAKTAISRPVPGKKASVPKAPLKSEKPVKKVP